MIITLIKFVCIYLIIGIVIGISCVIICKARHRTYKEPLKVIFWGTIIWPLQLIGSFILICAALVDKSERVRECLFNVYDDITDDEKDS